MEFKDNIMFNDRRDAGILLGKEILRKKISDPFILALPRGGVIVADEVAKILHVPVEVVVARKLGAPGHPEFGIGAISEDEVPFLNPDMGTYIDLKSPKIASVLMDEKNELKRRVSFYRQGRTLPDLKGRNVILVDDGLATGVTAMAAAKYLRTLNPQKLILAVPIGPGEVNEEIREAFDEILCMHTIYNLSSVGQWYREFNQVEDEEVMDVLKNYH